MNSIKDTDLHEWIDRSADGTLEPELRPRLEAALAAQPALAHEAARMVALHGMLADSRIEVRPGFTHEVVSALPPAAWERRRAWRLPLALAAGLGVAAAVFLAFAGGGDSGAFGTIAAIGDFFQVTLLAGAGLLGATWSGVTLAVDELFAGKRSMIVALVVGVIFLDLLFLRMLRRRSARSPAGEKDAADVAREHDRA